MGLVLSILIHAGPYHSTLYTLSFPKSKFQQEAGKASPEEGGAGSGRAAPRHLAVVHSENSRGCLPTGEKLGRLEVSSGGSSS